jgi:hypothetical protein
MPAYKDGCLPLEHIQDFKACYGYDLDVQWMIYFVERNAPRGILPQFWSSVEDLIRSAWSAAFPEIPFISPLHGAAYLADAIPLKLTGLILRVFKDQLRTNDTDLLPLHLAILGSRRRSSCRGQQHPRILNQQAFFIQRLLELDPSPVETIMSTISGRRSPFCQAIAAGLSWHIPAANDSEERVAGPLQHMFRHCPSALLKKDSLTGLYPFMLAGTASSKDSSSKDEEARSLDTIYNILRVSPESIRR